LTINADKKQFLHPHKFNEGLKLLEFGCDSNGLLTGLALLLSSGNGRGGGDLHLPEGKNKVERDLKALAEKYVGSWAGDRIVVAGDYGDPDLFGIKTSRNGNPRDIYRGTDYGDRRNLYKVAQEEFEDISYPVRAVTMIDSYIRQELIEGLQEQVKEGRGIWGMESLIELSKLNGLLRNDLKKVPDWDKALADWKLREAESV
jgi:hypothetical protein